MELENSDQMPGKGKLQPKTFAFWCTIAYALTVMVGAGGSGILIPWAMPSKEVGIDALTTFVMATLAPIIGDLIIDSEVYGKKLSKGWRVFFVSSCFFCAGLALIALLRENHDWDWTLGIISVLLSVVIWIMLTLKSERFLPAASITGSIGGRSPSPVHLPGGGL